MYYIKITHHNLSDLNAAGMEAYTISICIRARCLLLQRCLY